MDKLTRSLDAFRNATPDQDALTAGAAAFFDVSCDEVTPEQRAAWKWATLHMRDEVQVSVEPEAAAKLRACFVERWPALGRLLGG